MLAGWQGSVGTTAYQAMQHAEHPMTIQNPRPVIHMPVGREAVTSSPYERTKHVDSMWTRTLSLLDVLPTQANQT